MAERPVFIPLQDGTELVRELFLSITWHGGFAPVQKKKNVTGLHSAAAVEGYRTLLEISSKSDSKLGQHLSAFHLKSQTEVGEVPLECAFQGSKVFEQGGPFCDLYLVGARAAKQDQRLRNSGHLVGFRCGDVSFPLEPKTAFYDWLYLRAIYPHREWLTRLYEYAGFTDVEFNPHRSINCQARSCALFVSLARRGLLDRAMESPNSFIQLLVAHRYAPTLRTGHGQNGACRRPIRHPKRQAAQFESLWHVAEAIDKALDERAISIHDLARQEGFPYAARNKMVRIGDIVGIIAAVADDGLTFELRDQASGQLRTFHTKFIRKSFGDSAGGVAVSPVSREEEVTMQNDVLYFPSIHVHNVGWLKSALLLWDHVYRIVPDGFETHDDAEARRCLDAGKLRKTILEQEELLEVAEGYRTFLDSLKVLPDGLDDGETRAIHRGKIHDRLYPRLLELAKDFDANGFLRFGYGTARGYMFYLSQVVARRRNLARATDDPDAWAVAPFFSEKGNFTRHPRPTVADNAYGALILEDLMPRDIADKSMVEVLKLADQRRDERAELRSRIEALNALLFKIESKDHAEAVLADFVMALRHAKDEYRKSLGFGNRLDRYCSVGVGLAGISGMVISALSLPEWSTQMSAAGLFIGAIAGYATYKHLQHERSRTIGAYLLDVERLLPGEVMVGVSQDSFVEFMDD